MFAVTSSNIVTHADLNHENFHARAASTRNAVEGTSGEQRPAVCDRRVQRSTWALLVKRSQNGEILFRTLAPPRAVCTAPHRRCVCISTPRAPRGSSPAENRMDRAVWRDTSVVPRERVANKKLRQVQSSGAAEQVVLSRRDSQSHNTRCCPSPRVMMQGREAQRLRRQSTMQGDSTLGNDCDIWPIERQMLPSLPEDFVKGK